jgi:subtilisin family serine protease
MIGKRAGRGFRVSLALVVAGGMLAVLLAVGPLTVALGEGTPSSAGLSTRTSARIAVKLAPGFRLAQSAEGTLRVAPDWTSLPQTAGGTGLPLRVDGTMANLGITILDVSSAPYRGSDSPADVGLLTLRLQLTPGVLWAEEARPMSPSLTPDDPQYPAGTHSVGEWDLDRVGLPKAWDITTGSRAVTVAFVDSGLNGDVADFAGRIVSPYNPVTGKSAWSDWQDVMGHGTAVAGVAAAQGNDGVGMAGAAWNVRLMPVRVADEDGSIDDLAVANAIEYATNNGANVINISLGAPYEPGKGKSISDAVAYALSEGVVIVAAAGNDNSPVVSFPAALPGVIAVGATNRKDSRWSESLAGSNGGADLDLMAPGTNVLSYYEGSANEFTDDYVGTSFACPIVAGVAALMLSVDPSLTPQQVTDILTSTADDLGPPGWDADYGWGMVDAAKAVAQAAAKNDTAPTTTTTTTLPASTTTTTATVTSRFNDVSAASTPYWRQIEYLAGVGVVGGMGDGLFHPYDNLTRQQFAKMIVLALGMSVDRSLTCPFVDVQQSASDLYPYYYVAAAFREGVVQGTNPTHFSPYASLTRAQLITMIARAAHLPDPPEAYAPNFPNFSPTHYPSARKAAYAGLLDAIVGMGPNFDFLAPAERGEVCALLYALLQ